ncbi:cytidine deaminase, partial [Vibrio metschnikovii]|nr:cytidine deaminase [Vibrio metschnikovii]
MHSRIEQALSPMPAALTEYLTPIVTADHFDATLSADQFNQLLVLSGLSDADLRVALLPLAAAYAYV